MKQTGFQEKMPGGALRRFRAFREDPAANPLENAVRCKIEICLMSGKPLANTWELKKR